MVRNGLNEAELINLAGGANNTQISKFTARYNREAEGKSTFLNDKLLVASGC